MISELWQKLGFWSKDLINTWKSNKDWLWFHAVSVGELKAVWPLILKVNQNNSHFPIMISCTTKAGYELAKGLVKENKILVFYFPFDFPQTVNSFLNHVKVKLLVIVETEIWPNILKECNKRQIPVILVNARLSDKSFKNYLYFKFYFKNIVNCFNQVLAQSENDANKFLKLGLKSNKVKVLGNIKFSMTSNGYNSKIQKLNDETNIIFASTHKGEEEIAVKTYKELLREFCNIRLIIAPRHINRISEISDIIKKHNFLPKLKTQGNLKLNSINEILLIDTIGELQEIYKISDITILGGTFSSIGGHNILEPIWYNSYTIIGPNDFKILELSTIFKKENAIVQVNNSKELTVKIKEALLNKCLRDETVKKGIKIIKANAEVLERTYECILSYL